jgi:hypothetical protein
MNLIRQTMILSIYLLILTGCTTTKEYYQTFKGASDNWSAELVQDGKVEFKNHKELEDQYEIKYEKNEIIKLIYIGKEPNLGRSVEYSFNSGGGSMNASEGEVISVDEVFTHLGGTSGTSHIPKDLNYKPVDNKSRVFEITVKWNSKEEKIKLKYAE